MDDSRADTSLLERVGGRWALAAVAGVLAVAVIGLVAVRGRAVDANPRPWIESDRVVVEVLNGSGRTGLARQVTRRLRLRGIDVIYFGNARAPADSTEVLVRRGPVARGHDVARALEQGSVRPAPDSLRRVDVTIVLGRDYRPPAGGPPL